MPVSAITAAKLVVDEVDATAFLNWAESKYPKYFPSHRESQVFGGYTYRYYPETGNYLAVVGSAAQIVGAVSDNKRVVLGSFQQYACEVFPEDCSAPTSNAGATQSVLVGATVMLDGTRSSGPPGEPLVYAWLLTSKPSGSNATLASVGLSRTSFVADRAGNYVATLTVSNTKGSTTSTVAVLATFGNLAPIANAGGQQSVVVGVLTTLNGTGSVDPDGGTMTYRWTATAKPAGSAATLSLFSSVNPQFLPDLAGTYVFALVVNDGQSDSLPSTISIAAVSLNAPPIADAGGSRNVSTGSVVNLSGALSSDANGDPLTFNWILATRPLGSTAALLAASPMTPFFTADTAGLYVVTLTVSDGKATSLPASVTITATGATVTPVRLCCKVCSAGKPCGNSCISKTYSCHVGAGCAC